MNKTALKLAPGVQVPTSKNYRVVLFTKGVLAFYPLKPDGKPVDEDGIWHRWATGWGIGGGLWSLSEKQVEELDDLVSKGLVEIKPKEIDPGFKHNYLIPRWKAIYPTVESLPAFEPYYSPTVSRQETLDVFIPVHTVSLDTSWTKVMTRRPGGTPSKTFVIPSGDVAFTSSQADLMKVLNFLLRADKRIKADFHVTGSERYRGQTVGEVAGQVRDVDLALGNVPKAVTGPLKGMPPIVAYHGTSKKRWALIKTKGLIPNSQGKVYVDLIPGFSDQNVYLALDPSEAENYATRQAIWDTSSAVVLKVVVKDPSRLITDEDAISWEPHRISRDYTLTEKGRRRNTYYPEADKVKVYEKGWGFRIKDVMEWVAEDKWVKDEEFAAFYAEIMAQIPKFLKGSLQRGTFAYKGKIPASDISLFMEYKRQSYPKEDDLTFETYQETRKQVQEGIKRPGREASIINRVAARYLANS